MFTTGLHASEVKKHFLFLMLYIAHHHIFQWFSNNFPQTSSTVIVYDQF